MAYYNLSFVYSTSSVSSVKTDWFSSSATAGCGRQQWFPFTYLCNMPPFFCTEGWSLAWWSLWFTRDFQRIETGRWQARAAVSTERRWPSSLCTRGTSDSRTLGWNSLCTASSWVLSPGRILHAWRKSTCLPCHKRPEWQKIKERWQG